MYTTMKCIMCLTEKTENINSLCDSCKTVLLHANLMMNGKLNELLWTYLKNEEKNRKP